MRLVKYTKYMTYILNYSYAKRGGGSRYRVIT